jgi:alkanesulfonate monooxygenase SsuD/methylene tetrahydromethanopterin reductase-like flavin-dependent oxidoreductase (luciferase family)
MSSPAELRVGAAMGAGMSVADMRDLTAHAEAIGMDSVWLAQLPNQLESGAMLAALAATTERIRLGTAILPLYSRPPVVMAQTALTADELSGGRVTLGLGLGHREFGDWSVGTTRRPPVAATREYLAIVTSLIRDGEVNMDGRWYSGHASYPESRRADLSVQIGAFGPRLIELAAESADGIVLWMCSPAYVREHVRPALERGWRKRGGRPPGFGLTAMLHAGLTGNPAADRAEFARQLAAYLRVPSYRALFAASGFDGVLAANRPDTAMVAALGAFTETEMAQRVEDLREVGVTELVISPAGQARHSMDLCLGTLSGALVAARGKAGPVPAEAGAA